MMVCKNMAYYHDSLVVAPDGRLTPALSAPSNRVVKDGIDPLLPQEPGSLLLGGISSNSRSDSKGKAPVLPQLAGSVPADT